MLISRVKQLVKNANLVGLMCIRAARRSDMQFFNNWVLLRGCTEFEDHEDARERRHLKRLWLATDRFEKRPDVFMGLGDDLGWKKAG